MRSACLRVFFAGLLLLGASALAQTASETLEREARSAFKAGRFREAGLKFQESAAAAANPDRRGRMELQSAWSHYNDRNMKLAKEALKRALTADPEIDIVPEFFSPEFVALSEETKRSMVAPPPATEADLKELKRIAAEKLLDRAYNDVIYDLSSVPKEKLDAEAWELLARAYELSGKAELAADARRQAGKADPGRTGTSASPTSPISPSRGTPAELLLAARAALERGDVFQAQAGANRAIELEPNSSEAFRLLGDAFSLRGEKKLAEANWQKSLQLDPRNEATLATLTDYFISEKNLDQALELATKLAELNPGTRGNKLVQLGREARKSGDLARARYIYATAAKTLPPEASHLNEFAVVLVQLKEIDAAIAVLQAALNRDSKSPILRSNVAAVLHLKGKDGEAEAEYRKALESDPDYVPALNGLGGLLLIAGKSADARPLYERSLAKNPANADALIGLARALRQTGKLAEAAAVLENRGGLEDADVYNEAGAIAYERGLFSEAVSFFEKAIWKSPDHKLAKANREKAWRAAEFLKSLETAKPPAPAAKPGA